MELEGAILAEVLVAGGWELLKGARGLSGQLACRGGLLGQRAFAGERRAPGTSH